MALLRFFKVPKHQQYEYKPRFWDPKKEEMEERLKQLKDMEGQSPEAIKARLASSGLRRGYAKDQSFRSRQMMRSNLILLALVVGLLLVSYLVITVYLPKIVQVMESGNAVN